MKRISKTLLLLFIISIIVGCQKEEKVDDEIDVKLTNTETYSRIIVSGDEEGAVIKTQAKNYEKSEIIRNETTNMNVVYKYKPIADFVGKDYVIIEIHYNKTGVAEDVDTKTLKINFTVSK